MPSASEYAIVDLPLATVDEARATWWDNKKPSQHPYMIGVYNDGLSFWTTAQLVYVAKNWILL